MMLRINMLVPRDFQLKLHSEAQISSAMRRPCVWYFPSAEQWL
jgi:hypothetical protein